MAAAVASPPQIYVLAGVNGAGKSSIMGATIRDKGAEYYNPDEAARVFIAANPELSQTEANAAAWQKGRILLQRAIDEGQNADPAAGQAPTPVLVLHMQHGKIVGPPDLTSAPSWSWPIVAAAVEQSQMP